MHILVLTPAEVAHAVKRHQAYGNSPGAIARHFRNRGERAREHVCHMVHVLERRLGIDLGALCSRYVSRLDPGVDPFVRAVLESLAEWVEPREGGGPVLLVHVHRVQRLNELAEGAALERREQALLLARVLDRRPGPG
ncbi:MAG: hypothetical protein H0V09_02995 [Gemmatimonadetes bacterium]|nr:hypothetical protein [Gemmatimonadota bacterium]